MGALSFYRSLIPASLKRQFNLALALLIVMFIASGLVAVQSLDETARSSSQLSNERLALLEKALVLERTALQIEKETSLMQHSSSFEDMQKSYDRIVSYLHELDKIVEGLGQTSTGVSILTFQHTAQLFKGTIHVLAKLHEQAITNNDTSMPSSALPANLELFNQSLALQGRKLLSASEDLSNEFGNDYRTAVRQLNQKAELRRWEVLALLGFSISMAWLVSSQFLGKTVISRLQKVSEYLRKYGEETQTEPNVPVTGNDEIAEMARAVEHYMHEHEQLSKAREQAAQSARFVAVGQLAAGIAHEINTPTQYIDNNLHFIRTVVDEMVQEESLVPNKEDLSEVIDAIVESREGIKHISAIVQSMKEFSHPGATERAEADLNRALENALSVSQSQWKHVAEVERLFDPDLPLVTCDIGKINQVFLNLIVNAAQALEGSGLAQSGRIAIATSQSDNWVEIRISDNGPGIPEDIRERVFDPFFTTKDPGKGTGQGLAICHDIIVHKHGGSIEVSGDDGAEFIIKLPVRANNGSMRNSAPT